MSNPNPVPKIENLKPFTSDYQPSNRGRKQYIGSLKHHKYTQTEVRECILTMLAMTVEEMQELLKNPNVTMLEGIVGSAIEKAGKSGDNTILESLLSRAIGKPIENIKISSAPEFEATKALYYTFIRDGLEREEAVKKAVEVAKIKGYEIAEEDILNATYIS